MNFGDWKNSETTKETDLQLDELHRKHHGPPKGDFYNPKLGCILFIIIFLGGAILLAVF